MLPEALDMCKSHKKPTTLLSPDTTSVHNLIGHRYLKEMESGQVG